MAWSHMLKDLNLLQSLHSNFSLTKSALTIRGSSGFFLLNTTNVLLPGGPEITFFEPINLSAPFFISLVIDSGISRSIVRSIDGCDKVDIADVH